MQAFKILGGRKLKGEFTLVLGGNLKRFEGSKNKSELISEINSLVNKGISASDAIKKVSQENGYSRRLLYELLHKKKF